MSKKKSFIHENRNYILAFLFIAFLLVLIIFYNVIGSGVVVPEGSTDMPSSEVGISIGTPPREALQKESEVKEVYNKQEINKRHDFGFFETELKSLGFYEHDGIKEFRIDIWVHNVADGNEDFLWEKANIQKIPNQKWGVTSAEFDGSEIPSNGEREGYLLFKDIPKSLSGEVRVIIGNSVAYSAIMGFTTQSPHTYEITLD